MSEFSKNSFSYIGSAVNNANGGITVSAPSIFNTNSGISDQPGGGNLMCSNSSNVFSPAYVINGTVGGGIALGSISNSANAMNANTGRCQQ